MDFEYCRYCKKRGIVLYDGDYLCRCRRSGITGDFMFCRDVSPVDCRRSEIPAELREDTMPTEYFDFLKVYTERANRGIVTEDYLLNVKKYLQKCLNTYSHEDLVKCDAHEMSIKMSGTDWYRSGRYRRYYRAISKYQDYYLRGIMP